MSALFLAASYYLMVFLPEALASVAMLLFLSSLLLIGRIRIEALMLLSIVLSSSLVLSSLSSSSGISYSQISEIGAVAIEDGSVKKGGMYGFPSFLTYGHDGYGLYSSLGGEAYIYSSRNSISKGDRIKAEGQFSDPGFFSAESIEVISGEKSSGLRKRAESILRARLKGLDEECRDLALMLLLARSDEGEMLITDLARKKGVSHVFALSGMHLSIISSLSVPLFSLLMKRRRAEMISLIPLFLFTFLSGFRPSLLRALIFYALNTFFPHFKADEKLALTFIIHSALYPESLLRPAAVFSYLSISAIIVLGEKMSALCLKASGLRLSSLWASIFAVLFTVPYSYHLFGSYSISGIIYSPIINFLVTIYMGALLIFTAFPFFPSLFSLTYKAILSVLELPFLSSEMKDLRLYYILLASAIAVFALFSAMNWSVERKRD